MCPQVSIACEHPQHLVAADGADLHHVQVRVLEEVRDDLVAEIVEMQPCNAGFIKHQNCATPGCAEMRLQAIDMRFQKGQAP